MSDDPHRDDLFDPSEDEIDHHRARLWLSHIVVITVVLVAAFNPVSLERWAASNPPSWGVETVRLTVRVWTDRMQLAGLNTPRDWITARWNALKSVRWEDLEQDDSAGEAEATETPPPPAQG